MFIAYTIFSGIYIIHTFTKKHRNPIKGYGDAAS